MGRVRPRRPAASRSSAARGRSSAGGALRDEIHAEVLERAWSEEKQAFAQSYDSDELDASVLLMPLVGFLPRPTTRIVSTVEAIRRELTLDGLVLRYKPRGRRGVDGLPGGEGVFLPCSFWLVDALALQGRVDEARELFERLLDLRNDVGLLSEEYDPAGPAARQLPAGVHAPGAREHGARARQRPQHARHRLKDGLACVWNQARLERDGGSAEHRAKARNEALFREVNERIREAADRLGGSRVRARVPLRVLRRELPRPGADDAGRVRARPRSREPLRRRTGACRSRRSSTWSPLARIAS